VARSHFRSTIRAVPTTARARSYRRSTFPRIPRGFSRHDVRLPDYSIINDRCHHYTIMLYYISLENQRKQLEAAGFAPVPSRSI
jgi:hypothetical protein